MMARIGKVIAIWRNAERIGVREAAKRIGLSPATLNRIEHGENMDGRSMMKLLDWLFGSESRTLEIDGLRSTVRMAIKACDDLQDRRMAMENLRHAESLLEKFP